MLSPAAGAAERCKLLAANIPVTMTDSQPVISAGINGAEARFVVDTGAMYQFLSPAAAARFKLPLSDAPMGLRIAGLGGTFTPQVATVRTFTLGGVAFHGVKWLVGGNDFGAGLAGLLGQDLFRLFDLDLDFPDGILRLIRPEHCRGAAVAYWAGRQPVSVVDLEWTSASDPHLIGTARLDGRSIRVLFDTGAGRSILSLRAARRAGIAPSTPGVVRVGMTIGMGQRPVEVWRAPVALLEIGDEKIEHTHVLIGNIDEPGMEADMLIGADFFLSHHVYVANSQRKLYFTYSGGPVFALDVPHATPAAGAPTTGASTPSAAAPSATPIADTPRDAAQFMQRGTAYAARGELHRALADLTQACTLSPGNADDLYQRGLVRWRLGQGPLALADFDAALKSAPDDYRIRLARAELRLPRVHAAVESDLDAVDRLAPPEANLRIRLAALYDQIGEYAGAVHQLDLWVEYHRADVRLPTALNNRCWSEAAANVDVNRAVEDCTRALELRPGAAVIHDSRGLAYLRLGHLHRAIADYNAALKKAPKLAASLYGRGLAELRLGEQAKGAADLATATAARPQLAAQFSHMGLAPSGK
jgi:tetratricopeptide (TPR) repeat protein/predicted aspartyl protease